MVNIHLKDAYAIASRYSDDPRTQNGAILLDINGNTIGVGANTLPWKVNKTLDRLERPLKYSYMEHAERNAIYNAARHGFKTFNTTLVVPWYSCCDCARSIIQAGIKKVIGHKQVFEAYGSGPWDESINIGNIMLKEAGVELEYYDGKIGGVEILLNGVKWKP